MPHGNVVFLFHVLVMLTTILNVSKIIHSSGVKAECRPNIKGIKLPSQNIARILMSISKC